MKVSISRSKNTTIYYLSKSVRINGKSTTKTVEKIGTEEEIRKRSGGMEPREWAKQYAAKRSEEEKRAKKKCANDPKRFIAQDHCTMDGEIAERAVAYLDETQISEEEKYDGFYAVCTNLEDDAPAIIRINQRCWEIEECFRIMKSEFKARPVYLSRKDRITALIIYRILEKKLGRKYTCEEIISQRNMKKIITATKK